MNGPYQPYGGQMTEDRSGYWTGPDGGMYTMDPETGQYSPYSGPPPTAPPSMPAADPSIYAAAEMAGGTDPMAAETGMARSAWSTALHEGMAGGKGIREIMAEFNPGMFGRYNPQPAAPATPQNPYMPGGMPGMGAAPAPGGPSVGQFGMGGAPGGPPQNPYAPPGFSPAPAQGLRPGPLGRLQQRTRPMAPGQQPSSQSPRSRRGSRAR